VRQETTIILGGSPVSSLDDYLSGGGSEGLTKALAGTPEETIAEITASGLRGRGGAGFPTGAKWEAVRSSGPGVKHMVCNAAEGEPGTFKDRLIMRKNPYQVIEGLAIAAFAVGAQEAHIGLKKSFTPELAAIRRAIEEMSAAGLLGAFTIEVHEGPDEYLFGEEKALMEVLEGNLPMPRILPPFQEGLYATPAAPNPTAVNNVETLSNVPHIMREGARWYRRFGTESSPGTMLFTITGDVKTPGVYELPLGTPLRALVEDVAGGVGEGRALKVIIPGASAGVITAELLDTPMDFDALREAGSGLGSAGFIVFDDTACIVRALLDFSRFLWIESCAQCPACKQGSADITAALQHIEDGEGTETDLTTAVERTTTVTGGQRCSLPTGEALLVSSSVTAFRDEFEAHLGRPCPHPRELPFAKLLDYDETNGRFVYDERYHLKRPDWTYAEK
jgi:NADH:ubiquinone oxidoreductase subunit F (NADH-binding)